VKTNPWTTGDNQADDRTPKRRSPEPEKEEATSHEEHQTKGLAAPGSSQKSSKSFRDKFLKKRSFPGEDRAQSGNTSPETETPDRSDTYTVEQEPQQSSASPRNILQDIENRKQTKEETDLPHLSEKAHKQLNKSFKDLSLVEGNIRSMGRNIQSVYCTSCFEKEGKTTATASVAFGLAEFGNCNVLLMDSNHEMPHLHRLFGIPNSPGLQEILAEKVTPEKAITATAYEHLYILPAGEGKQAVSSPRFEQLMKDVKAGFDFIIIDGKTLFASSEVNNAASIVDAFILVVQCENTKWEVVQLAQDKLVKAGAQHAGILLNQRRYYLPGFIYRLVSRS